MDNNIYDDLYERENGTSIVENTKGLINFYLCLKFERKFGKQLKKKFREYYQEFAEALSSDLSDDSEIDGFFSKKVGRLIYEIIEKNSLEFLTRKQIVTLFVDLIVPIAYKKTGIYYDWFFHCWIIELCKSIWIDLPLPIKEPLCYICNKGEGYVEIELGEREKMDIELKKYPELYSIIPSLTPENDFIRILKFKNKIPNNLYAHYVKQIYIFNSLGVKTETLHAVFDGLSKEDLMSKEETKIYNNLSSIITIYRGTDVHEVIPRISWTLDKIIAEKYCSGQLFSATIPKERILACFDTFEKEVLVWLELDEIKVL